MTNIDRHQALSYAVDVGRVHDGEVNLDEGIPFDIYNLFELTTLEDYDGSKIEHELLILEIARAFEEAHAANQRNLKHLTEMDQA